MSGCIKNKSDNGGGGDDTGAAYSCTITTTAAADHGTWSVTDTSTLTVTECNDIVAEQLQSKTATMTCARQNNRYNTTSVAGAGSLDWSTGRNAWQWTADTATSVQLVSCLGASDDPRTISPTAWSMSTASSSWDGSTAATPKIIYN